jgi:iron(III) transport system substrate-binding protein
MKMQNSFGTKLPMGGAKGKRDRWMPCLRAVMMGLSMLVISTLTIVLSAASTAHAASSSDAALVEAAKKERNLTIIHGMPQANMQGLAKAFNRLYPFIEVEIERQQGLAVYEKYNTETRSGSNLRDIVMLADMAGYRKLIENKMIMNYRVPTDAGIPAQFKIEGGAYAAYLTTMVVIVNDKLVSQEEGKILKEWEGILDPRWKGRIGTAYPAGGSVYGPLYMYLHPPTPGRFGEKFLKGIAAQQPQIYNSTATAIERVIAGEIQVLFTHFESDAIPRLEQGAPIRWYAPKPTPSFANAYFGIAAKAPHPNAAKLFMNWILSEDGATAVNKISASISALSTHKDQRDLPKASWYMPVTETFAPDVDGWIKYQDADVKLWREIFNYKPGR